MKKLTLPAVVIVTLLSGCVVYSTPQHSDYGPRYERDRDRDGIPNRHDRDRDGDGVLNRHDRQPNNPRRY